MAQMASATFRRALPAEVIAQQPLISPNVRTVLTMFFFCCDATRYTSCGPSRTPTHFF
jgi:hypothetical protein